MRTQFSIPPRQIIYHIRYVAIFGSADVDKKHPLYQEAFNVARYLAYHDKVVIDGGGPGVMDAATQGAESAGGETIAITFTPINMPEFEGRFDENIVDKEIKTANYIERMFGLMNHADAFIIFQGGTGTLSEWTTAWLLAHLYYGAHKPLILYGEFWHEVMRVMNKYFFIGDKENKVYKIVKNEAEMVKALADFEQELAKRCGLPRTQHAQHSTKVVASSEEVLDA